MRHCTPWCRARSARPDGCSGRSSVLSSPSRRSWADNALSGSSVTRAGPSTSMWTRVTASSTCRRSRAMPPTRRKRGQQPLASMMTTSRYQLTSRQPTCRLPCRLLSLLLSGAAARCRVTTSCYVAADAAASPSRVANAPRALSRARACAPTGRSPTSRRSSCRLAASPPRSWALSRPRCSSSGTMTTLCWSAAAGRGTSTSSAPTTHRLTRRVWV